MFEIFLMQELSIYIATKNLYIGFDWDLGSPWMHGSIIDKHFNPEI